MRFIDEGAGVLGYMSIYTPYLPPYLPTYPLKHWEMSIPFITYPLAQTHTHTHKIHTRNRYLLAYLALPWEDRFYELGRAPEFGTQAWTGEPPTPEAKARRVRFWACGLWVDCGLCMMCMVDTWVGRWRCVCVYVGGVNGCVNHCIVRMVCCFLFFD